MRLVGWRQNSFTSIDSWEAQTRTRRTGFRIFIDVSSFQHNDIDIAVFQARGSLSVQMFVRLVGSRSDGMLTDRYEADNHDCGPRSALSSLICPLGTPSSATSRWRNIAVQAQWHMSSRSSPPQSAVADRLHRRRSSGPSPPKRVSCPINLRPLASLRHSLHLEKLFASID